MFWMDEIKLQTMHTKDRKRYFVYLPLRYIKLKKIHKGAVFQPDVKGDTLILKPINKGQLEIDKEAIPIDQIDREDNTEDNTITHSIRRPQFKIGNIT